MARGRHKQQTVRTFASGSVLVGSCLDRLATLPDGSVDSIVTDPPYEIGFMGKGWDSTGIAYNVELWRECLRVLKPGGHLLAFGATRSYHRMAVAIEDAGFEVRDSIHWMYGSGFPKSLDVSKAIDKQRHDRDDIYRVTEWVRAARDAAGITNKDIDAAFGTNGMAGHWTSSKSQPAVPTLDQVPTLLDVLGVSAVDVPDEIRRLLWDLNGKKGQPGENWAKREVVGTKKSSLGGTVAAGERDPEFIEKHRGLEFDVTAPATDAAKQWSGWGTALKPAHEPIVVARKPLAGTVAANVLEHGTGALNIDGCRVDGVPRTTHLDGNRVTTVAESGQLSGKKPHGPTEPPSGRWPANIVFTHAADCVQVGDRKVKGGPTAEVMKRAAEKRLANGTPGSNIGMDSWVLAGARTAAAGMAPSYSSPDGTETIPAYRCAPGCPVAALDQQSGVSKSQTDTGRRGKRPGGFGDVGSDKVDPVPCGPSYGDTGGASRFFTVTEWSELDAPFRYVAKPGKKERNAGLGDLGAKQVDSSRDADAAGANNPRNRGGASATNFHPTVKPVALMRWLVRLVTPEGGTVLDPFLGSGTTAAAAILEGRAWVGCEMTADYLPIIEGRVAWAEAERASGRADNPRFKTPPATDTAEAAARPAKDDTSPPQQAGLFDVA